MKKIFTILALCCFSVGVQATPPKKDAHTIKEYTKANYPVKAHHDILGFDCKTCHGNGPKEEYKALSTQDCFYCHKNYKSLAKRTGHLGYDDNIHASPHYPDMDCDSCHSTHRKSKNYCVMCHSQESMKSIKVP